MQLALSRENEGQPRLSLMSNPYSDAGSRTPARAFNELIEPRQLRLSLSLSLSDTTNSQFRTFLLLPLPLSSYTLDDDYNYNDKCDVGGDDVI